MEIKIAKFSGFCIGVRKAVEKALESTTQATYKHPIYCLGHLVHNAFVVHSLREKGVIIVNALDEIHTDGTLIISAHGVPPQIIKQAPKKKLTLLDTTCIQVNKVQKLAQQLSEEGRYVIIIGDKNHPEVKGVKEWAGPNSVIISSIEEAEQLCLTTPAGVVSQTTISLNTFQTISDTLVKNASLPVEIYNTICSATHSRQKSAIALAHEVDIMIIIGDKKSANTTRLFELSKQIQPDSYLVSEVSQIDPAWFNHKKITGITAGASTPAQIIESIITAIENISPHE